MDIIQIVLIALGLSMDAFAVSVCKGLSAKELKIYHYGLVGLWFGGFQCLMPLIGYFIGQSFVKYIETFDHWIAFAILVIIGINMIRESLKHEHVDSSFSVKNMFILAIATSIDALTVGVSFSMTGTNSIWFDCFAIGVITFIMSAIGLGIGKKFGDKLCSKAQIFGGAILIIIGIKILLEHLGVLNF